MAETKDKENIALNGNDHQVDHDEYQYLHLIENIIKNGKTNI